MSSDEHMDERLSRAGERWRATYDTAAEVDLAAITAAPASEDGPSVVPITQPPHAARARRPRRVQAWLATAVGIAAAVAATVLVVSLRNDSPPNRPATEGSTALVGANWTLSAMRDADGTPRQVIEPAPLTFAKDNLSGTDACNHIGGTVTISAALIEIGPLSQTEMACVDRPAGFDAEVALIKSVLSGKVQWSITDGTLTLTKPGIGTLVYSEQHATTSTDPASLAGRTWTLATVERGTVASTPSASVTLIFGGDAKLTIDHTCYQVTATVSAADAKLVLSNVTTLQHNCPPIPAATQQAEQAEDALVDTLLRSGPRWSVDANQLTIGTSGERALVFTSDVASSEACAVQGTDLLVQMGGDGTLLPGNTSPLHETATVGSVVQVTVGFGSRAVSAPATSSDALVAMCSTKQDYKVTTYFRAAHTGQVEVTSRTTDCPGCAQLSFTAVITVVPAGSTGTGATTPGATASAGSPTPGVSGAPGASGGSPGTG